MEADELAPDHPLRTRLRVERRALALLILYIVGLVGIGAILARVASPAIGTAVIVLGLLLLCLRAFMTSNRAGDAGMGMGDGGAYGDFGGSCGGDGGGGDGGGG